MYEQVGGSYLYVHGGKVGTVDVIFVMKVD